MGFDEPHEKIAEREESDSDCLIFTTYWQTECTV